MMKQYKLAPHVTEQDLIDNGFEMGAKIIYPKKYEKFIGDILISVDEKPYIDHYYYKNYGRRILATKCKDIKRESNWFQLEMRNKMRYDYTTIERVEPITYIKDLIDKGMVVEL